MIEHTPNTSTPQPGMKWHKFQIYFSTWFNAFSCFVMSFLALSVVAEPVGRYRYNSDLVSNAALLGVVFIALGIYFIYTRFALASYKASAPNHLLIATILSALVSTLFLMMDSGAEFTSFFTALPVAILTRWYYAKRDYMFLL
jgi:hypothetical protein